MALWSTTLRIGKDLKLLVTSPEGDDLALLRHFLAANPERAVFHSGTRCAKPARSGSESLSVGSRLI